MAVPVLHGVKGESAAIVEREDVGLLFEPQNAQTLTAGLIRLSGDACLIRKLKTNGPIAAQKYDRSSLALSMLVILKRTANPHSDIK